MRVMFILMVVVISVAAQRAAVQINNASRPASSRFQIGDRFEIVITGPSDQPVSVRTTRNGQTDWGPVISRTDVGGRWSTSGRFEKSDFGSWSETWTVGSRLANPVVEFSVGAPCLKEGQHLIFVASRFVAEDCETADGQQKFTTPSDSEPFRTPDGRVIPGRVRVKMTAEQYQMEIMESRIASRMDGGRLRQHGDDAVALITRIIGVNALSQKETSTFVHWRMIGLIVYIRCVLRRKTCG